MATTKKTKPALSSGALVISETENGNISITVEMREANDSAEALVTQIRATLAGIQYVLRKNQEEITQMGEAYIEGLETGVMASKAKEKKEDGAKIGFHAEI